MFLQLVLLPLRIDKSRCINVMNWYKSKDDYKGIVLKMKLCQLKTSDQGYIFLHVFLLSSCGIRRTIVISFLNIVKKMSETDTFYY